MTEAIPPWHCPAGIRAVGGGSEDNGAFGKPGEIRRRKVTGLGRGPGSRPGGVMFAGLRAKQGKPCGAKVWGLPRGKPRNGSPPAGFFASVNIAKKGR